DELADDPAILSRFVEEAQIGGQLQHPGIVPVYELGLMADERPFFTMKLVKGRTLSQLLAERQGPGHDQRRFLSIFEDICQTMAYAHSRGVIHRDLKPSNVMVGAFGEVQVVDWGLAKVLRGGSSSATAAPRSEVSVIATVRSGSDSGTASDSIAGAVMGTPAFMSPEQAGGDVEHLDERTDVFALGGILCEMLTDKPPYPGPKQYAIAQAAAGKQDEIHERLAACAADSELVALARTCMAPVPADRPRNAGVLVERIGSYLSSVEHRAEAARVEVATEKVKVAEERRRRKLTIALSGSVVLILVAASSAWIWFSGQRAETKLLVETELATADADLVGLAPAQEALQRARAHLESGFSSPVLEDQIEQAAVALAEARKRFRFRDDLSAIRMELGDGSPQFKARRYSSVFAAHGIPVDSMSDSEIVRAVEGTGLAENIAPALDDWARLLNRMGRANDAHKLLKVAVLVDPDELRNRLRWAILGRDVDALLTLAESGEAAKMPPISSIVLADGLEMVEHPERRLLVLLNGRRRHPDDFHLHIKCSYALLFLGRHTEALAEAVAAEALNPTCGYALVIQGEALHRLGLADAADERFEAAVALNPDDHYVHGALGEVLAKLGLLDRAIDELRIATELEPTYVFADNMLFKTLEQANRLDEALEKYDSALLDPPEVPWLILRRGVLYARLDRAEEAAQALQKAVELNPGAGVLNAVAFRLLLLPLAQRVDPKIVVSLARKAVALTPVPNPDYQHTLGVALYRAGEWQESVDILEALQARKSSAGDQIFAAMAHAQLGNDVRAREVYDRVLRLRDEGNQLPGRGQELEEWIAEAADVLGIEQDDR
ncbi:MAG: serine/threonine-protein kinase, partial [Planctomycetota bacterium]